MPNLVSLITPIYTSGNVTEYNRNLIIHLIKEYLSNDAIEEIPEKVSAFRHYLVPRNNTQSDHFAQMEYIYLAWTSELCKAAPSVIYEKQRLASKKLRIALSHVNQVTDSKQIEPNFKELLQKLNSIKSLFHPSDFKSDNLTLIVDQEIQSFVNSVENVVQKYEMGWDFEAILNLLQDNFLIPLEDDVINDIAQTVYIRLLRLLMKGKYLQDLKGKDLPVQSIRLGLMQETSAVWAAIVRRNWAEVDAKGCEVIPYTETIKSGLLKAKQDESKSILTLENMAIYGATWDHEKELLSVEDVPSMAPVWNYMTFNITQYTSKVKKILKHTHTEGMYVV